MNVRRSVWKQTALVGILAVIIAFISLCMYNGVRINQDKISPQVEMFSLGDTVNLEENFFSDATENPNGYSITVNSAELVEYVPFLESFGITTKDFGYTEGYPAPEYTYLLHVTVANTDNTEGALMAINYALYDKALKIPVDYSLWSLMDEGFPGEAGFRLRENSQVDITIPFTPMSLDTAIDNEKLSKRMENSDFYFCVSEFPVRKMVLINQKNYDF